MAITHTRPANQFKRRALGAAVFTLLAACSGTARTSSVDGGGTILSASLTDFKIAVTGIAPAGKAFEMMVRNDGKTIHSMALDAPGGGIATPVLNAGQAGSLSVPALKPGTYKLFCSVGGHREAGMEATLNVGSPGAPAPLSPEEMDRAHEQGVKAFPAKTEGSGGVTLLPKIVDGVKVFDLAAKALRWEVSPGQFVDAYAFNNQIPGPQLRARRGDRVRIVVHNELPESTAVHFHGLTVPNAMDGVPYLTQPPIKSGTSFTYEFTIGDAPGSYMYHSHHNALAQVGKGLYGSFVVDGPTSWNQEATMFLGDGELGYTLNGKGFPATTPIIAKRGTKVLVRFANAGQMLHPMHLHGFHFTVIARDGVPTTPTVMDTVVVAPGERYDVVFTASLPGTWAFHCHILSHAESEHGMHGMVTAVVVK